MADLVTDTRKQIEKRLKEIKPKLDEYERLIQAKRALDGATDTPRRRPARQARTSGTARKRAPRGQNREKALAVVNERPGITVGEIAEATGVGRPTVYNLTSKLAEDGVLVRENLGGGRTGFKRAG